ncbi:MAG: hypothetical protein D6706_20770 [Chloroflexi bacterium]|nr:MAG: hypothetical protein D6706_20770 [Chloroflexota bacterium]
MSGVMVKKKSTQKKQQWRELGQGLIEYAILLALVALGAVGTLAVVGTDVGEVFSRITAGLNGESGPPESVTVQVVDASGRGIPNVRVYAFTESGRYFGRTGVTDKNGEYTFADWQAEGRFKFRAWYQGHQHWSDGISFPAQSRAVIDTGKRPFTVRVVDAAGNGINNVRVYAFNGKKHYIGVYGNTDENGELSVELVNGEFTFRADYRAHQYWADMVTVPDVDTATIQTGERPFTVRVVDAAGNGINNVRVYAFDAKKRYIGVYGNTDSSGNLVVKLPDGDFMFRADYRGYQYWSEPVSTPAKDTAVVQTGERPFTVRVLNYANEGIPNVRVYAFNADRGWYVGVYGNTDANGELNIALPEGKFKFRADYRGYQYWSAEANIPTVDNAVVQTGERPFTVKVVDADGNGLDNVRVYAFNADRGWYVGVYGNTDANGNLQLNLPEGSFKFRADYRGYQYWSATANIPAVDNTVVQTGERKVTVSVTDASGNGIGNVRVYAFNADRGWYVGVYGNTDANGNLQLSLPEGSFKFRADYQGQQFWSDPISVPGSTAVTINTGQRDFTVHVLDKSGNDAKNAWVHVFNTRDQYVGVSGKTDASGRVTLNITPGTYKFRVDYRGTQVWSGVVDVSSGSVQITAGR